MFRLMPTEAETLNRSQPPQQWRLAMGKARHRRWEKADAGFEVCADPVHVSVRMHGTRDRHSRTAAQRGAL
jgi:hypothetical protein